jgi:hypothetical protein
MVEVAQSYEMVRNQQHFQETRQHRQHFQEKSTTFSGNFFTTWSKY